MKENRLKRLVAEGKVPVGTSVFEFASPGIGRIAAQAGVDFVMFDMEHSGWSFETVKALIATTRSVPLAATVRVPAITYEYFAKAMDIGAQGVVAPMVETRDQAELLAASIRYAPEGRRGVAVGLAMDDFSGGDVQAKLREANRNAMAGALIETVAGVENVDAIAAVKGVDILWIGHYDLTNSMGIPGQFTHRDYLAAVDRIIKAAGKNGKPCGISFNDPADAPALLKRGFRALMYWGDVWLYKEALTKGVAAIRAQIGEWECKPRPRRNARKTLAG
jgi:2-dehydro-3-deoxyglucarate aldolase/4-hydroxy-2-oxoheptanedioate aldolase